jgi:hypothetical protein
VYNPPGDPNDEDWLERAYREDLQAAGLLTPDATPRLPLVWRAECAYQDWKWTVDLLWEAARSVLSSTATLREHGTVFYVCAVITQLSVANGEPLFEVEYGDE